LLACGIAFLMSGARELLLPVVAQHELAVRWETAARTSRNPGTGVPRDLHGALCRLLIPRLKVHFFVVEGDGQKELRIGPGHMPGTALPGSAGNCIIAGHRDTHFRVLKDLHKGDEVILETPAKNFHYRVTGLSVVSPRNRRLLADTPAPVLSLITCYPFYYVGPAPRRLVVRARLAGT
jgi:sortase A